MGERLRVGRESSKLNWEFAAQQIGGVWFTAPGKKKQQLTNQKLTEAEVKRSVTSTFSREQSVLKPDFVPPFIS